MPQQFDQITSPPTEYKDVTRQILLEGGLHHRAQAHESATQVGHSCHDPDVCSCRRADHQTRHSIAVRNIIRSTAPVIWRTPLASWISNLPIGDREANLSAFVASETSSLATLTGRSLALAFPNRPSRYSFRHLKT